MIEQPYIHCMHLEDEAVVRCFNNRGIPAKAESTVIAWDFFKMVIPAFLLRQGATQDLEQNPA